MAKAMNNFPVLSMACLLFSGIFSFFGLFFQKSAKRYSLSYRSVTLRRARNWIAFAAYVSALVFFFAAFIFRP